jgi:site-specific recombinase XerD
MSIYRRASDGKWVGTLDLGLDAQDRRRRHVVYGNLRREASLHTLRHSAASALIACGTHLKVVQGLLGHSTYAVTADAYAHIAVAQQRQAAERLREAFPW